MIAGSGVRVERAALGFDDPVTFAILADGRILVGEKAGTVWYVRPEGGAARSLGGLPAVHGRREAGLLDLVPVPVRGRRNDVLVAYARPYAFTESRTAVALASLDRASERFLETRIVFNQQDAHESAENYGGRIALEPGGTMLLALGDRGEAAAAADPGRTEGKVLRLRPDGSVPPGNPFFGQNAKEGLWTTGHADPAGLAVSATDGRVWLVERDEAGGDRLHRLLPGLAYQGVRKGSAGGVAATASPRQPPVRVFDPPVRPAGLAVVPAGPFGPWAGDLLLAARGAEELFRLRPEGTGAGEPRPLLARRYGPVRDVRAGPDGAIWFLAGRAGEGALYRMLPA